MKLPTVILTVVLVTIIGPAASIVYIQCQLAALVTNNDTATRIPDCK